MNLTPPTEHQVLVFFVALLVIVVVAKGFGAAMRRTGQPSVVGELAAGLVLGPSVLGRLAPDVTDWLFPDDEAQTAMLFTVGWLGVLLLLVTTGFETDLNLIRRLGGAAAWVSIGSLLVPVGAGFAVGWMIPEVLVGADTDRYVFALFIATALSISSLPVIAKILAEMGLVRRDFGQLTLAAGMANDIVGWILLGLVAGLARGGLDLGTLPLTLGGVLVFFALALTVGQRIVDQALRTVRIGGDAQASGLVVVLIATLAFAVITQWLHVEAVLGAFVAGIVLARSRFAEHRLIAPIESMTNAFMAPVFFATAGLRVDLGLLADAETMFWALVVLAVASVSKFGGALLGARIGGLTNREGAALGVGLNARGALEIVIATVGLSLGVLNDRSYAVVVLMAMATSMLAPPALRRVLRGFDGSATERARLDREEILASNSVVTDRGVLLLTRGGVSSMLAAQVVAAAWPEDTPVTLLTVGRHDVDVRPFEAVLAGRRVDHLVLDGGDHASVPDAVAREARLGYGVVVVGTGVGRTSGTVLSPLADEIVAATTVPALVVRMPRGLRHRLPWAFARAVVPVNGGPSTGGLEVAGHLSATLGTHLHLVYVDTGSPSTAVGTAGPTWRISGGRRVLDQHSSHMARLGANFTATLQRAESPAQAVMASVEQLGADLVLLSGQHRGGSASPALGNTIEAVLARCDVTLALVVMPSTRRNVAAEAATNGHQPVGATP